MRGDREFNQDATAIRAQCWNLDATPEQRPFASGNKMGEALTVTLPEFRRND